ncbi:MAG: hypothetical protein RLY20_1466 [Verrucomicrobiota bacterium]|jgi:hypothetical protein
MGIGFGTLIKPLCLKPVARINGNLFQVRSSFMQQLLSLFSYCKSMTVDKDARVILIERRMLWVWRRRWHIPFLRVRRINYGFSDSFGGLARAALEFYTVSFILIGPEEEFPLFSFVGEFSEPATWDDVLIYGERALYWGSEGGQAAGSREFVLLLQQFTGAPLA